MIQVEVFWVVTSYCVVIGYQRFRGLCSWRRRQHGPLKFWCPATALWVVRAQRTSTWIITAVKTSNLENI